MEECKPVSTPMIIGCKLSKDDEANEADQKIYRSMIGSLLYVTTSRPNIMQVVGFVARFQASPKETHVLEIKIFSRYMKGTLDFVLWYPHSDELILEAYTNED